MQKIRALQRYSTIVAVAKDHVIGKGNDIPWYLPADLKYFKKRTLHHHIIMGRKCFESIGRALPKRTNIIVTRNPFFIASNCLVVSSVEEALTIAEDNGETEAFIIGGGQIYDLAMPMIDRLYLTEVDIDVPEDKPVVKFPELPVGEWKEVSSEAHAPDEKNEYNYTFRVFERI